MTCAELQLIRAGLLQVLIAEGFELAAPVASIPNPILRDFAKVVLELDALMQPVSAELEDAEEEDGTVVVRALRAGIIEEAPGKVLELPVDVLAGGAWRRALTLRPSTPIKFAAVTFA